MLFLAQLRNVYVFGEHLLDLQRREFVLIVELDADEEKAFVNVHLGPALDANRTVVGRVVYRLPQHVLEDLDESLGVGEHLAQQRLVVAGPLVVDDSDVTVVRGEVKHLDHIFDGL